LGDSVLVCHDGNGVYIPLDSLEYHIAHDDCVGNCAEVEGRYGNINHDDKAHVPPINVHIQPNPAKDICKITVTGESLPSNDLLIKLVNLTGSYDQILYSGLARQSPSLAEYEINTTNLESGMYLVKVSYGSELQIIKLIIQH